MRDPVSVKKAAVPVGPHSRLSSGRGHTHTHTHTHTHYLIMVGIPRVLAVDLAFPCPWKVAEWVSRLKFQ